jgi:hypothetical protein
MNYDTILNILFSLPFLWIIIFKEEKLNDNNIFLKYLFISVLLIIVGIAVENHQNNLDKSYSYYISQFLFVFLIMHKIIGLLFYKIYNRRPKIVRSVGTFEDKMYSFIMTFAIVSIPFLIENYIVQKYFK